MHSKMTLLILIFAFCAHFDSRVCVPFWGCRDARQAHLDGRVAALLFANAEKFFVQTPEVVKVNVIASRVL